MFYRRKIVLALLQQFEGEIEKMRLHKLVFLYCQRKENAEYDFVPYKFGCYSYSLKADMVAMTNKEWITSSKTSYFFESKNNYFDSLKKEDKNKLNETVQLYGNMSKDAIVKHTYLNFPYYAINSKIASTILPEKFVQKIDGSRPKQTDIELFTIGYEGISLEEYLNRLVINNVKVLVDVRKNPLSMKFGFSKSLLKKYCNNLKIGYIHIPEVGIDSKKRKQLETQKDYDVLFEDYKTSVLKETGESQTEILDLLKKYKRIALTCFEADKCQCHRSHLAESIKSSSDLEYSLTHL